MIMYQSTIYVAITGVCTDNKCMLVINDIGNHGSL
jgi:hypothetical protein